MPGEKVARGQFEFLSILNTDQFFSSCDAQQLILFFAQVGTAVPWKSGKLCFPTAWEGGALAFLSPRLPVSSE